MSNQTPNVEVRSYIAIMSCLDCGTQIVSVEDPDGCGLRINEHKCSGRWRTVCEVPLNPREWKALAAAASQCSEGA